MRGSRKREGGQSRGKQKRRQGEKVEKDGPEGRKRGGNKVIWRGHASREEEKGGYGEGR